MAVAFAMHPTQTERTMSVADSGEVMPPKSTQKHLPQSHRDAEFAQRENPRAVFFLCVTSAPPLPLRRWISVFTDSEARIRPDSSSVQNAIVSDPFGSSPFGYSPASTQSLLVDFINQTDLDQIGDKEPAIDIAFFIGLPDRTTIGKIVKS